MSKEPALFDFAAEIRHETDKAYLLFDGTKEGWVPKSQTENHNDGTFTIPQWLAEKVGFA
jgi:hypothetical protein